METEEEGEEEETAGTRTEDGSEDDTISRDILGEEIISTETAGVDLT